MVNKLTMIMMKIVITLWMMINSRIHHLMILAQMTMM